MSLSTLQQLSLIIAVSLMTSSTFATTYYQEDIDEDYQKILSKKFLKKIDSNKDKKVSFDELLAYKTKKQRERLKNNIDRLYKTCDKNKDDKIDKTEVVKVNFEAPVIYDDQHNGKMACSLNTDKLSAYDNNGDGFIDKKEAEDIVNYRPNKKFRKIQKLRQKKRASIQAKKSFKHCDKDHDEQLSLREAASINCNMVTEQFDAHDKNKDGYLSLEERLIEIPYNEYAYPKGTNPPVVDTFYLPPSDVKYTPTPFDLLQTAFSLCDKNEDGRFAKSEAIGKSCKQEMWFFNQTDRNNDGFINDLELEAATLKNSFEQMDTDKNGFLEGKEFKGSQIRYL